MFSLFQKSGPRSLSVAIREALQVEGLPAGIRLDDLRLVDARGTYSGRKVTYFRVLNPGRTVDPESKTYQKLHYADLEAHRALVIRTGHVEKDGTVVLNQQAAGTTDVGVSSAAVPALQDRRPANTSSHPNDERFMARDGDPDSR